jgi:hypothetical protein
MTEKNLEAMAEAEAAAAVEEPEVLKIKSMLLADY